MPDGRKQIHKHTCKLSQNGFRASFSKRCDQACFMALANSWWHLAELNIALNSAGQQWLQSWLPFMCVYKCAVAIPWKLAQSLNNKTGHGEQREIFLGLSAVCVGFCWCVCLWPSCTALSLLLFISIARFYIPKPLKMLFLYISDTSYYWQKA